MLDTSAYSFLTGLSLGVVLAVGYVALQRSSEARGQPIAIKAQCDKPSNGHETEVDLNDEVIKEHLSRNILFFGHEGCSTLFRSHVVVIGLGGVGSHAAHLLLRSGVGKLTLVDFDQVSTVPADRCQVWLCLAHCTHPFPLCISDITPAYGLQVTLSSLNRHAVATRADIGLPKATVLAQHFRNIFPEIQVEAR